MPNNGNLLYKWGGGTNPNFPRIVDAYDEFLITESGEEIIDGAAGAAVVNLGHSVPEIGDVMKEQAESVSYLTLSHFSSNPSEKLAAKLADHAPGDLNTVFYANSGSEAIEAGIKLSHAYHQQTGHPQKATFISRWQSYHGTTLGALSVSGNTNRREPYKLLLNDWPHISPANPYRWQYDGTPREQAIKATQELETTIKQEGADKIAAFVAEPVGGASIPAARPHPVYYEEVRRICDEHNLLFIADEIMTGFGRTGEMFAMEHSGVVPDLMMVGKGLSGGYVPISAVMVRDELVNSIDGEYSMRQGTTFAGNPQSTKIACHVLDQYDDHLLDEVRRKGTELIDRLAPIRDNPIVGDLRQIGLMIGIEFVADTDTKEPFDPELGVTSKVYEEALNRGVYIYPGGGSVDGVAGDHVMISPPLTIEDESIERIADVVVDSVQSVRRELPQFGQDG